MPNTDKPITATEAAELKPCPFCGSSAHIREVICFFVECNKCWAHGPFDDKRQVAIDNWNRRAPEARP